MFNSNQKQSFQQQQTSINQLSHLELPFKGARKQKIAKHICSLFEQNELSTNKAPKNHSPIVDATKSQFFANPKVNTITEDPGVDEEKENSWMINLPKQMKESPYNDNNFCKKPENRPILKLLFTNHQRHSVRQNQRKQQEQSLNSNPHHRQEASSEKSECEQYQRYQIGEEQEFLEKYCSGERQSFHEPTEDVSKDFFRGSSQNNYFQDGSTYRIQKENFLGAGIQQDLANQLCQDTPFNANIATFKPLQLSKQLRQVSENIQTSKNFHKFQKQEEKVSVRLTDRLSSSKSEKKRPHQRSSNLTKGKSLFTQSQSNLTKMRRNSIKLPNKKQSTNRLDSQGKSADRYLQEVKAKTKYEKILDRFYLENKNLLVIQSKGVESTAHMKRKRSESCYSASNNKLSTRSNLKIKTQASENKGSSIERKIKRIMRTQEKRRTHTMPSDRQSEEDEMNYHQILCARESLRSEGQNTLRKTFSSSCGNLKQRLQGVMTQSQDNKLPHRAQNLPLRRKDMFSKPKEQDRVQWMKMNFQERQNKTIHSRREKQMKGVEANRERQIKECTFKPKLTSYPSKGINPKPQRYESYAKLYLGKIKNRNLPK